MTEMSVKGTPLNSKPRTTIASSVWHYLALLVLSGWHHFSTGSAALAVFLISPSPKYSRNVVFERTRL
jgi:hypothetical protein